MSDRPTTTSPSLSSTALTRRRLLQATGGSIAGGLVATAAPAGWLAAAAAPAAQTATRGGEVIHAVGASWPTLDPHLTDASRPFYFGVYEGLLRYELVDAATGQSELRPGLAESWEYSEDGLTLTLKLRQGVKFHDGTDWNADVAKWNLDRIRTSDLAFGRSYLSNVSGIDVVDPVTIRLTLASPVAALLLSLSPGTGYPWLLMISQKALEAAGEDGFATQAVGTGPFKLAEYVQDDHVTLERFDGYWGTDAGGEQLPYLDRFTTRIIRDNTVILTELQADTADVMDFVQPENLEAVKSNPELAYLPINAFQVILCTCGFNLGTGPFANKLVRKAAAHAVDRATIAEVVGFGQAQPWQPPFWSPAMLGWDDALANMYPYDVEKAKALLAEAGVTDGIDARLVFQARQPDTRVAEIYQQMMGEVGIRLELVPLEDVVFAEQQSKGDFDLFFGNSVSLAETSLVNTWFLNDGPANWAGVDNDALDGALRQAAQLVDNAERDPLYREALGIIMDEVYMLGTYAFPYNMVHRAEIQGIQPQWSVPDYRAAYVVEG